eukprot:gnl/MRDRNA2_/MRDRNA2_238843_c0_seq1.p1 gnl/MRDRNA2_/MRDRNA2_238843_c0~~gnl/MRDRNA2_/MRDRNA2_238843_c0_seq1.p1  ORF type:complete len:348 (+),score=58.52 gnl/MRDRNA2_/MRDRNA2_238843_c0_seq1:3-1046(+)
MSCLATLFLFMLAATAHGKKHVTNFSNVAENSADRSVDKSVSKLIDDLSHRSTKASFLHRSNVDNAILRKPHCMERDPASVSLATAKQDAKRCLEALRKEGLLSLQKEVKIVASPYTPGSKVPAGQKLVHLIRHGQGFHNLLADIWRAFGRKQTQQDNPYNRKEVLDPPLTGIGRHQAKELQQTTQGLHSLELVVVSPIRRAVETALIAFNHLVRGAPKGKQSKVLFLGNADCAERRHATVSDKRRPMSEIYAEFPMVDWSLITDEDDPLYSDTVPETWRQCSDRGFKFLLWLRDRPETEIAVATHSAWLFVLLNTAIECTDPKLADWFLTGELRSMVLEFVDVNQA